MDEIRFSDIDLAINSDEYEKELEARCEMWRRENPGKLAILQYCVSTREYVIKARPTVQ